MFANLAMAQELNCKVRVMHDKIQGVDPQVFRAMEKALMDFINTRKWTTDDYAPVEKIDCTFLFNLTGRLEGDAYTATINIQATRPVYNSSYYTSIINFVDRDVAIRYSQFSPLLFDDNRVSSGTDPLGDNLTATVAYYIYIILGLDYDSYSLNGGNAYFKKAQNIVNNAPEGKGVAGWKAVEGNKNRYWLVDQILNPRFAELHKYWYTMHRLGLDMLYDKPNEARQNIVSGISTLGKLNKENPGAILLQFFFNAKSNELINLLNDMPSQERQGYITTLSQIDVPNAAKYQALGR